MRTISQRELRNDNAGIIRAVEAGESFVVTKNGTPVALVHPIDDATTGYGLPLSRPARQRVDYVHWPRVASSVTSEQVLAELRDDDR